MTPQERLDWYEAFFQKVLVLRRHHYDKKRFIQGASEKEYRTGLEVDKMLREEQKRKESIKKELQNG
jgi:hypothetical protein